MATSTAAKKPAAKVRLPKLKGGKKILVENLWGDGNAFYILGKCRRAARNAGWTDEQLKAFGELARAGDHDHLVRTVMDYFDEKTEDDDEDDDFGFDEETDDE